MVDRVGLARPRSNWRACGVPRVFATAGTAEKCAACERLGAERAINYRHEEFEQVVMVATDGRGVDLILDMVRASYLARNVESLAPEGRLVLIGLMGGATGEVGLATLMSRRLSVTGSTLRSRTEAEKALIVDAVREHVWPGLADASCRSVVHAMLPFEAAAEAHRIMAASELQANSCWFPDLEGRITASDECRDGIGSILPEPIREGVRMTDDTVFRTECTNGSRQSRA